jgi:hypothetical protein
MSLRFLLEIDRMVLCKNLYIDVYTLLSTDDDPDEILDEKKAQVFWQLQPLCSNLLKA